MVCCILIHLTNSIFSYFQNTYQLASVYKKLRYRRKGEQDQCEKTGLIEIKTKKKFIANLRASPGRKRPGWRRGGAD
jgi:hypothetical protein